MKPVTCYLDPSGTILSLEGDWANVLGALERPAVAGESVLSLYPAERRAHLKQDIENLATGRLTLVDASFLAVPKPGRAGGGDYLFLRFVQDEMDGRTAIKGVGGLLPVLRACMYCEQVNEYAPGSRWEPNGWREPSSDDLENPLLSHGVCHTCYETEMKLQIQALRASQTNK